MRTKLYTHLALAVSLSALFGCATVMEGTGQSIQISTYPAGAACSVDRDGDRLGEVPITPGSIRVDKSKNDVVVTCSKEGFQTATVSRSPQFVGATFGNILLGGVVGFVADAASGADFDYPAQITLQLAPVGRVPSANADPPPTRDTSTPVSTAALPAGSSTVDGTGSRLFDGEYWGEMTLTRVIGQCSRPKPGMVRVLLVENGGVRFVFNFRLGTTLSGPIDSDAAFNASGKMPTGPVRMAGRVQRFFLVANVQNPTCGYRFRATKHAE